MSLFPGGFRPLPETIRSHDGWKTTATGDCLGESTAPAEPTGPGGFYKPRRGAGCSDAPNSPNAQKQTNKAGVSDRKRRVMNYRKTKREPADESREDERRKDQDAG